MHLGACVHGLMHMYGDIYAYTWRHICIHLGVCLHRLIYMYGGIYAYTLVLVYMV